MQLKKPVRAALAAASCSLLGLAGPVSADTSAPWKFDAALLLYKEIDRVTVLEPVINAKKEFQSEHFLSIKLVADTISGASPNGASASKSPQTFSRPSGEEEFKAKSGETPLDPGFRDSRGSAAVTWEQPVADNTKGALSVYFSSEFDFLSAGSSISLAHDLNRKNTTISTGFAIEADRINPVGGVPKELEIAPVKIGDARPRDGTNKRKTVLDFLLGITQVISRKTLTQLNYSIGVASGYNTDPYKIVSVINGATGDTVKYRYEKRPDTRVKHSIYWQTKHHLSTDVIDVAYRFMTDDWGIKSHTVEMKYRWEYSADSWLEPNFRFYHQSAANFYRHSIKTEEKLPENVSADYRLANLNSVTVGLKYGRTLKNGQSWNIRGEYFVQSGDSSPDDAVGTQKGLNLFPTIRAFIIKFLFSF